MKTTDFPKYIAARDLATLARAAKAAHAKAQNAWCEINALKHQAELLSAESERADVEWELAADEYREWVQDEQTEQEDPLEVEPDAEQEHDNE